MYHIQVYRQTNTYRWAHTAKEALKPRQIEDRDRGRQKKREDRDRGRRKERTEIEKDRRRERD